MKKSLYSIKEINSLFDRLFPLNRSILGEGYRKSLEILCEYIPFNLLSYPTGKQVLNWKIPKEWVIYEAFIEDLDNNRIIDFKDNNLYVVNYSQPIDEVIPLDELKKHIFVSPHLEDAVPYTTSYYKDNWGFCMTQKQLLSMKNKNYHACIKSEFTDGRLVNGECLLEGESKKEILITAYLCHPSMANNELSGPIVQAMLYQRIKNWKQRRFSYRFLINPETIGSIAYISDHYESIKANTFAGLVLTCLGGLQDTFRLKKSRKEDSPFDLLVDRINDGTYSDFWEDNTPQDKRHIRVEPFDPSCGSDERQYCSTGLNLPISQIARKVYGSYPEYHTSLDNKELMGMESLVDSCNKLERLLLLHEKEKYYQNNYPNGEIKLGDYALYPGVNTNGSRKDSSMNDIINNPAFIRRVMFLLNYSDGTKPLSYIARRLGCSCSDLQGVADILEEKGLIQIIK